MVCKPLSETHLRHIAGAIYRSDEITSAKQNFTSEDAKFCQDDNEISFDTTKIRGRFSEISRRTFVEFSLEQRTKFGESCFQYSCTAL